MDLTSVFHRLLTRLDGRALALAIALLLMILSLVMTLGANSVASSVTG